MGEMTLINLSLFRRARIILIKFLNLFMGILKIQLLVILNAFTIVEHHELCLFLDSIQSFKSEVALILGSSSSTPKYLLN